jgi:hypothetical protein
MDEWNLTMLVIFVSMGPSLRAVLMAYFSEIQHYFPNLIEVDTEFTG